MSESTSSQNQICFFNPVDKHQMKNLVDYIKTNSIEVSFKVYDVFSLSSFIEIQDHQIAIFKKHEYEYNNTYMLCLFKHMNEMYFFRSKVQTSPNYYLLDIPEKIYTVQRREDFRFTIPSSIKQNIKIVDHSELQSKFKDFSLGGCRLLITSEEPLEFQIESDLELNFELHESLLLNQMCTIVFTKYSEQFKEHQLGLKFNNPTSEFIKEIHNQLLQIERIVSGRKL